MVSTFLLTVIFDLTVAVEVGLVLACLFFIYRVTTITTVEPVSTIELGPTAPRLPQSVQVYRIYGSLFFGAVSKIEALLDPDRPPPAVLVLEMGRMIQLDSTGLDALESLHQTLGRHNGALILCAVNEQPLSLLQRTGFHDRLQPGAIVPTLQAGLELAATLSDPR